MKKHLIIMNSKIVTVIRTARQKKKYQQRYFKITRILTVKSYRIMKMKFDLLFHVDVVDLMVRNSFLQDMEEEEEAAEAKILERNVVVKIKV